MLKTIMSAVLMSIALSIPAMQTPAGTTTASQCCSIVAEALKDYEHLKPGMKRGDVEAYFKAAGGMTFRDKTTYVYKSCEYIKVDIGFQRDPNTTTDFSSNDIVTAISPLTVGYPAKD
ncbi:MAG TPA: hypothetical protein VHT24_01400 [Pseudacidobacterium sp.]|nr:hypothetical protein [Pseudacidobacterium sp.]